MNHLRLKSHEHDRPNIPQVSTILIYRTMAAKLLGDSKVIHDPLGKQHVHVWQAIDELENGTWTSMSIALSLLVSMLCCNMNSTQNVIKASDT